MSERIELSEHSWIEDGHLITTNALIAFGWESAINKSEVVEVWGNWDSGFSWNPMGYDQFSGVKWRIPISILSAIYGYRDGESWCTIVRSTNADGRYREWIEVNVAECLPVPSSVIKMHTDAVVLCSGSAGSLRKLWEVIKEVGK